MHKFPIFGQNIHLYSSILECDYYNWDTYKYKSSIGEGDVIEELWTARTWEAEN